MIFIHVTMQEKQVRPGWWTIACEPNSLLLPENPFQGGAGASRRPRGAVFVLQRHLPEWKAHPWAQVLLWAQDRRHGRSMSSPLLYLFP